MCPAGYCLWTVKWSGRTLEQRELCTGATSLRGPVERQDTADYFSCMTQRKEKLYWGTHCTVGVDCTGGWQVWKVASRSTDWNEFFKALSREWQEDCYTIFSDKGICPKKCQFLSLFFLKKYCTRCRDFVTSRKWCFLKKYMHIGICSQPLPFEHEAEMWGMFPE